MEIENESILLEKKYLKSGYIMIKIGNYWKSEHIWVVETFLNRELTKEERVHHLDSNKKNNSIENLMVFPNDKEHIKFHNKVRSFGFTRPILRQIQNRWKNLQ